MQLSYFQIFGILLALTTIWLDTRENILARPLSLIGTVMSLFVYYPTKLYAKCFLNVIYIFLSIYGWYQWLYGGKDKTPLQVSKITPYTFLCLLLGSSAIAMVMGNILHVFFSANFPYWDSLHTMLALLAQWMLTRKKLESWVVWILADVLYTVVCYYKGLYLFSALHVFYIFLAVYGYCSWHTSYLSQAAMPGASEQKTNA